MLRGKEPNALDYFELRRLQYAPPHFEYLTIKWNWNLENAAVKWIDNNLKGRYYIGTTMSLDSTNTFHKSCRIGFEDGKESSYFVLACPLLKYK